MSRHLGVALLHATFDEPGAAPPVRELATALGEAGHDPTVLASHRAATLVSAEEGFPIIRSRRLSEAPLRARGFTGPLTHLPATAARLLAGDYAVAHAFTPADAAAALWWRRLSGRPVVFTWIEQTGRELLADRRLRLQLVRRATEDVDAVVAPSDEVREGLRIWLAIEPPVIRAGDALAHEQLYRRLIAA